MSKKEVAELQMPLGSLGGFSQHHLIQPTPSPIKPLVTQMQLPTLQSDPNLNLQSVDLHTQPPILGTTLRYPLTESQSHLTLTSSHTQFQHHVHDKLFIEPDYEGSNIHTASPASQMLEAFTEKSVSQPPSEFTVDGSFGFLQLAPSSQTQTHDPATETSTSYSDSVTQLHLSQTPLHQLFTRSQFHRESTSPQIFQTKLDHPGQPHYRQTHQQPSQISRSYPQQSVTSHFIPKFYLELSTVHHYYLPSAQDPTSSITKPQPVQVYGQISETKSTSMIPSLSQTQSQSSPTQHPQFSTLDPEITVGHEAKMSDQLRLNGTQKSDTVQSVKSPNDTELTEWLKRNTSQSPMTSNDPRVTQQSPSWLPVLEKHDIPIVVGVGVSLAFIFITVTFYSVVQKNEPAPTSRSAQRNLGVPIRNTERRAAGRPYENRAFEDDDCVAVIEQSPNTSDTRARPPGHSEVTVQMEPTLEDLQEDTRPALDNHSVTVETYPEPILDTKIDSSLEEDKGCSLSQPSIQLQCAEEWNSNRGDNNSPCQDAFPPPSPLPSHSSSPSPPSRNEESLRSSLTVQSAEPCVAPLHHSLSISHGNPPLLLSHHVSLGLTTVAVDVHFYPAASTSTAVGTTTHITSISNSTSIAAPLFSPPLINNQGNDQSASRFHRCK
ncbi:uncharacterized protein LOC113138370 isoform X1 [Mastacembelus armatus]|uniref:uncharacterized protein LOC113138370 isoform X1 n=1 Tax=Mastacembelus armatus TaxID=205130 RepID=UPI000E45B0BB|nr:uncharacterized protein LOC113138370 isoform X1 [Mastacembelus armatus]